jgi:hypothetical protein
VKSPVGVEKILYHLETIDIENDEYMFWDANGNSLKALIEKERVIGFANAENKITLQHAFSAYVQQLGVSVDTTGTPEEIWDKIKRAKDEIPRRPSFLSRLFKRAPQ